jgi:hypothetical protein
MAFEWTRERKVKLLLAVAKELDPFWDEVYVALGPKFMHMNRLDIRYVDESLNPSSTLRGTNFEPTAPSTIT